MSIGILGQKVGMTRVYDEAGTITPVTVILAEPNSVLQVKTLDNDGYTAAQVGVFDQNGTPRHQAGTRPFQKGRMHAETVRSRVHDQRRRDQGW